MLCLFDACSHILTFIAGHKKTFLSDALITVLAKSSEKPFEIFVRKFEEAGATSIRSDQLEREI